MKHITELLNYVSRVVKIELYIFWLSYFALLWSILFIVRYDTILTRTYQVYAELGLGAFAWALLYFKFASIGLLASASSNRTLLQVSSFLMFILWLFTSIAVTIPYGAINSGTLVYGTFAAVAVWVFLRATNHTYS